MKLNYWCGGKRERIYVNQLPWGNNPDIWIEPKPCEEGQLRDWRLHRPQHARGLRSGLVYDVEFHVMFKAELRFVLGLETDGDLNRLTFRDIANHATVQRPPVRRALSPAKARRRARETHVFIKR